MPQLYRDQLRAQKQAKLFASIRQTIQQKQLVLRLNDKGNNFYLGSTNDFEVKVQKYFPDTNAFQELLSNPFRANLDHVCTLLNQLHREKRILAKHYTKMMPDRNKAELAHLYFNPKTHKV